MKNLQANNENLSDEELLEEYRRLPESDVIGTLFNRYVHLVYGLCLKYLKSRADAQDAVMSIFESITEKLKTHEVKYFKSWLYSVAKNQCLMYLRSARGREVINGEFMEMEVVMHPIDEQDGNPLDGDLQALEDCMKKLRQDQQTCVRLFFLQQKSYQEIVNCTTFSLSKVKSYIQNGKRNLKICLEKKHVKG